MDGVTRKEVQDLKEKAVRNLMGGQSSSEVEKEIDAFFTRNRFQILDILDDAFEAHEKGLL